MASSSSSASRKSRTIRSSDVMYANAVYFPNSRVYRGDTPGSLNYACISHIFYAFANVAEDGGVYLSDEWADAGAPVDGVQGALGSLMHLKQQHPHLQVLLTIGGGGSADTFPTVAANAVLRDNFARSARGLVEASALDGIDIVWEYPCDANQGADFLALLDAVRAHLPEEYYLVTAGLPGNKAILQNVDLRRCAAYLDYLNLMAYDFFGSWTHRAGHHAQLYAVGKDKDEPSAASGVRFCLERGFPAKKILLGIPVFGRSFLHVTGPGHRYRGMGGDEEGLFEYCDLPRRGTKEQVDKRAVAAQCVGGDGGFVTYDNPETVKLKAAFCKQKGLGGLFYFSGPSDAKDSKRSLIAAGFRALHSS